ncbi:MAG TPA: hypothetical protein VM940_15015 [Chthoniobacterales bacterium]|jgi:hypothetical protein|nr:hypothetical protein [Chthoniobacterales bacterium]
MLEELRKWVRAVPFQPFSIELNGGRMLPVPHPDHILFGRGMVAVEDDAGLIDVVAGLHIAGIRSQSPSA